MNPAPLHTAPYAPPAIDLDRRARRRKRVLIALSAVFLAYCIGDCISFLRAMDKRKPTLKRWLPYAAEIGTDDQLYERHPDYLYPPVFLVLLKPLTWIPPKAAAVIWQILKYASILICFAAARRMFTTRAPPADWVMLAAFIVSARFIHSDLRHGNINLFIAALVIGAGACLVTNRSFMCGLLVAIAACIKVTPALWGLYLLYRRDNRALVGCAIGALLMLEVIPAAALGTQRNHALLDQWRGHVLESFLSKGEVDSVGMNQSLTAVTNRLLGHSSVEPEDRVAIMQWRDDRIRVLQKVLAVLILLLTAAVIARRKSDKPEFAMERAALDWSLLAPVSLALSGYSWTGHFCVLIPALVAFFWFLSKSPLRAARNRWAAGTGFAACVIFIFTTDILTSVGREFASRIGAPLAGAMLLFVSLAVIRHTRLAPHPRLA